MVSTLAEIQTEVLGLVPSRQNLTINQGADWPPGGHVAAATYSKAFWMQARQRPSSTSVHFTLSTYNGGIKHWGHDFFRSGVLSGGTVWKTFSLVLYNFIAGNDVGLTTKYGQTDWQAGGLYDLFLSAQQTAALDFRRAGYEVDMLHPKKGDAATLDLSGTTVTLTNDGTETIGGLNVGKMTRAAGSFATLRVGELIYFTPGATGTISLNNTWDTPGANSQYYRVTAGDTLTIDVDRPWQTLDGAGTIVETLTTTGLPHQLAPTTEREWMNSTFDKYTSVVVNGDNGSSQTELTFTGGDLTQGIFTPVAGDILLVTGQESIATGEVDISGLQTVAEAPSTTTLKFTGTTSGTTRTGVSDILLTDMHGTLSTRILQGKITLDKEYARGY